MRIVLAGNYRYAWYEQVCADALRRLGHEVMSVSWFPYFVSTRGRIEEQLAWNGPMTWQANRCLVRIVNEYNADILFIWRGVHVTIDTLRSIRRHNPRCIIISYNNDDPFGPLYASKAASFNQRRLWRRFRMAIPEYDYNFVFRPVNISEYRASGAKRVHLLMPYFVQELHRHVELTAEERARYGCDVVFVGHYEADGRESYLRALVLAGLKLRIFGNGWPSDVLDSISVDLSPVGPVLGDDYAKSLCGAKLCLAFLSKLNRDTYTRRNFEIPACRRLMLAERTYDLQDLFAEGREAVYFENESELVEKALHMVRDDGQRESIAKAGYDRVWADGHDVVSRMGQMLAAVAEVDGIPFTISSS